MLGEESGSYAYSQTGEKISKKEAMSYGQSFGVGDTLGTGIEIVESGFSVCFFKNGTCLGEAFLISNKCSLFPHISMKNCLCRAVLSADTCPMPGAIFVADADAALTEHLFRPPTLERPEMLMMIGLPSSGKTHWVRQYMDTHPEKEYYVLDPRRVSDMLIADATKKRTVDGKDINENVAQDVFNEMVQMAVHQPRNYIIDQSNHFSGFRKKTLLLFSNFHRVGVVVVPSQGEFEKRYAAAQQEGRAVSKESIMNMKENFTLPSMEEGFEELRYVELDQQAAEGLVQEDHEKALKFHNYGIVVKKPAIPAPRTPNVPSLVPRAAHHPSFCRPPVHARPHVSQVPGGRFQFSSPPLHMQPRTPRLQPVAARNDFAATPAQSSAAGAVQPSVQLQSQQAQATQMHANYLQRYYLQQQQQAPAPVAQSQSIPVAAEQPYYQAGHAYPTTNFALASQPMHVLPKQQYSSSPQQSNFYPSFAASYSSAPVSQQHAVPGNTPTQPEPSQFRSEDMSLAQQWAEYQNRSRFHA